MAAQKLTKHYQKPWQLLVAVCLSRKNTLTKDLSDIEKRYGGLVEQMEVESAVYNNYEMRKQELQNVASKVKASKKLSEKDEERVSDASRLLASIQDQEDMWITDASKIQIPSKASPCDGNTKSLHRLLDQKLHMVVEDEQLLKEACTVFPYTTLNEGETLREASERLLETHGIQKTDALFLSNAPAGIVKIRFKEDEERGQTYQGAKVFFTKARITSIKNITSTNAPVWLSIDEMKTRTKNEYFDRVEKFV